MAGTYEISISQQVTPDEFEGKILGYRLKVTLTAVDGFEDAGLFVFLRGTDNDDNFTNVASPVNLADIPLDSPTAEGWIRHDNVDLVFSRQDEAIGVADDIMEDLKLLCDSMAVIALNLTTPTVTTIASED